MHQLCYTQVAFALSVLTLRTQTLTDNRSGRDFCFKVKALFAAMCHFTACNWKLAGQVIKASQLACTEPCCQRTPGLSCRRVHVLARMLIKAAKEQVSEKQMMKALSVVQTNIVSTANAQGNNR